MKRGIFPILVILAIILFQVWNSVYQDSLLEEENSNDTDEPYSNATGPNLKDLNIMHDAIMITDGGISYVLTNQTDEYKHGVLGDSIEAGSLTIIDGNSLKVIDFSPQVFEGLYPIIADLNSDGENEIITTLSGDGNGAQIVVFDHSGNRIASTKALPWGWRHVLAVDQFGPNGEIELVDIKQPHVSKEVQYFRMEGKNLVKAAGINYYSTHNIGSRNLELFGVLEDQGNHLLIVPTPNFKSIAAIGRTSDGAEELWRIDTSEIIENITVEYNKVFVNGELIYPEN